MRISRLVCSTICLGWLAVMPVVRAQDAKSTSTRKIVSRQAPQYPEQARPYHLSGRVKLQVSVGSDGKVKSEQVIGGNPVLADAALKAVEQWKWEPSLKPSSELVEISFQLDQ